MADTLFASQFRRIGGPNLVRQFGESLTYHPRGGVARTVKGIVERDVEVISEAGVSGKATIVRVLDKSVCGIQSTEIDTGGDEIEVSLRVGDVAKRKSIMRVMSTANGVVRFMVQ